MLDKVWSDAIAALDAVQRSRELTAEGKTTQRNVIAKRAATALQELVEGSKRGYGPTIARLRSQLETGLAPKRDDVQAYLRQREIRDYLKTMDPLDVDAYLGGALERGQLEVLDAVLQSPVPMPTVSAELITGYTADRLEAVDAKVYQELRGWELGKEALDESITAIGHQLRTRGLTVTAERWPHLFRQFSRPG